MSTAYLRFGVKIKIPPYSRHWALARPKIVHRGQGRLGSVKILLNDDVAPKTCENFRMLCTHKSGYGYINSRLHHIVNGFGVYGGDLVTRTPKRQGYHEDFAGLEFGHKFSATVKPHGRPTDLPMPEPRKGLCGRSAYAPDTTSQPEYCFEDEYVFEDESFEMKHDKPGIVTMANTGPNTNNSNFVILTEPAPYLDGKNVAFGEVVWGLEIIHKMMRKWGSDSGEYTNQLFGSGRDRAVYIYQAGVLDHPDEEIPERPEYNLSKRPFATHGRIYNEPYKYST